MKKTSFIIIFLFIAIATSCFAQSNAQFGHINYTEILQLMPGFDTAQSNILKYHEELQQNGQLMVKEFQKKSAELESFAASATASQAIIKIKQEELQKMYNRIQEYSQSIEMLLQEKRLLLLEPFQTALANTIKTVAKAGHYTYIFDTSTLASFALGNDITNDVKKELGIQ